MFLLRVIEFGIAAIFLTYFVTQVIIPLWQGTPLFPSLREKKSRLQDDLVNARGEVEDAKIRREVAQTKAEAEKYNGKNEPKPQKKTTRGR